MKRIVNVVGLSLGLAACACGPSPRTPAKPAAGLAASMKSSGHRFARGTSEQVILSKWNRGGVWKPVMGIASGVRTPAMISRDSTGDRLVVAAAGGGYDVYRIRLSCGSGTYSIVDGRRTSRDDGTAQKEVGTRSVLGVPSEEIRRACADRNANGTTGTPADAVQVLRKVGKPGLRPASPIPDDAERAKMWRDYKLKQGIN